MILDRTHPVIIQVQTKYPKTHKVSMLFSTKNHIYSITNAREGDYYLCHPKYIALI
nr:MAG TPA: butirosin biosynthesis protein [Bacteriophage sp.]